MFGYYLDLGWRSLRRQPVVTALMVLLVAVGVALTSVTFAALRTVAGEPIPGKSETIFVPQLGNRAPALRAADGEPPWSLSYIDASALLKAGRAWRQTATYAARFAVVPTDPSHAPFTVEGYAVTADFFRMFDVPLDGGHSWDAADDARGSADVVISRRLDRRLFGSAGGVGQTVRLGEQAYRITGVVGEWNPQPHFYAGSSVNAVSYRGDAPDVYLPLQRAIADQVAGSGGYDCLPGDYELDWATRLRSECNWVNVWIELRSPGEALAYRQFLDGYAAEQQRTGRWSWPPNVRLRNLGQWLDHTHAVPEEVPLAFALASGLQLVCLINVVGLLLAKFMRRSGEIGVRRALGASQRAIAAQFLTEGAIVGFVGGALGIGLTLAGVLKIDLVFPTKIARLVHVDAPLLAMALVLSILATLLASLYPAWRAMRVQPAWQLKAD
jgi:putative ABC transport system permease protein